MSSLDMSPIDDSCPLNICCLLSTPELVFTELVLQILYWIYEIAIHSGIFILEIPTNIDLGNLYYFFLSEKLGYFLFI
jgi:hypothetical protein